MLRHKVINYVLSQLLAIHATYLEQFAELCPFQLFEVSLQ